MTIGTGTVSMSDIRTEFGVSGAISMSDMYRGGTNIRQKAANNTGNNLASGVPTSGTISIDNFKGQGKGFRYTYTSGATNQNISALFGSDYSVNYPKEVVINSGVELGATSTSDEALQADTGLSGTLTITNNGTLTGAGGAAGGGAGGDAFEANVTCTFINNGTLRAGGGGGGAGGTGGGGQINSTTTQTGGSYPDYCWYYNSGNNIIRWFWNSNSPTFYYGKGTNNVSYGGWTYSKGAYQGDWWGNGSGVWWISRSQTSSTNTNGGSGGSGGRGQGYSQTSASGSSGSSGGTNAGTGGSGGGGGSYGSAGGSGNSGANGNRTNGSSGTSGGAAGKYLRGSSNVTFTNNGTVLGGTA